MEIEKLRPEHDSLDFACGRESLDLFLRHHALQSQSSDASVTYVAVEGRRICGYFTLAAASVERDGAAPRVTKGLAKHPIPCLLLARLAVDSKQQGQGLGAALIKDALKRAAAAADLVGARVLLVHAKDESAARFYHHFGFESANTDPLHMMLLMKDIRRLLRAQETAR